MTNPLANTPIFLGITQAMTEAMTKRVALRAISLAFVIVAIFALSGEILLQTFGITIEAFRIAGGVLVAVVGYQLLLGKPSSIHKPSKSDLEHATSDDAALSVAVSPIAMPILAGPGTLVTAMNYSVGSSPLQPGIVILAFFLICIFTYVCFVSGRRIVRFLGNNAITVVSRVMGLLLTVVGTQMLIEGIRGAATSS